MATVTELASRFVKASRVVAVRDKDLEIAASAAAVAAAADAVTREQERQALVASTYAAGYDDGLARAQRDGAAAAVRCAEALEQLVTTARGQHVAEVQDTSRAVLAAAVDIAEWILRHELPRDTRSLLTRLDEAAASLLPSPDVRVRVSSADEEAVQGWAAARRGITVTADPALRAGDAHYDTDAGSVEVSVAAALRIAAEALGIDPARGPA